MSSPLPSSSGAGGKRGHDEMEGVEGTSLNSQVPATSERASMEVIEAQRMQIQEVEEKLRHEDKRHRQEVAALHNRIDELTKLVPNGNGDRTDEETTSVFQLLPENWDYILPYLNPTDFQTLINSTPRFRTLFKSERADKLLPAVLPIVLKTCGMSDPSELLCWRGVNKPAKSIVDNLLEESSSPQNYQDPEGINSPLWTPFSGSAEEDLRLVTQKIKSRSQFYARTRLQRLADRMIPAPGEVTLENPFLTKSVVLENNNILPNRLVMSMVQRYGHLIQSISFTWICEAPFLFSILSNLPNLRTLVIWGAFRLFTEDEIGRWIPQVKLDQLEVLDVRDLYVDDEGPAAIPVLATLLSCIGTQLHTLVCGGEFFIPEANLEKLRRGEFPNLRTVRVDRVDVPFLQRFSDLRFPLPLQEIELEYLHWREPVVPPSFMDVNRSLATFANTVTHLKVDILLSPLAEEDANEENQVSYPNLSTFTIYWFKIEARWFDNFIQRQAPQLTELNLVNPNHDETPELTVIIQWLQELRLFEKASNLQKINILCGFVPVEEAAAKIIIERSGAVRTVMYKNLPQSMFR